MVSFTLSRLSWLRASDLPYGDAIPQRLPSLNSFPGFFLGPRHQRLRRIRVDPSPCVQREEGDGSHPQILRSGSRIVSTTLSSVFVAIMNSTCLPQFPNQITKWSYRAETPRGDTSLFTKIISFSSFTTTDLYILTSLLFGAFYLLHSRPRAKAPYVGYRSWLEPTFFVRIHCLTSCKSIIAAGYKKVGPYDTHCERRDLIHDNSTRTRFSISEEWMAIP